MTLITPRVAAKPEQVIKPEVGLLNKNSSLASALGVVS
jgi:hypothetical protein